ncbi:30S ribosomal protein THX [Hymenobacter busanensis]|uniref:30S ribosomal protein THX n=1 Tax=Hymenobacter busanensis TaxID=2607656 RepID=A0A7L4ZZ32_9BACT|nr:30S ribosomal protein THX [Hymenobacter busanensis]KAA9331613.1 30S ribosomal protein THX [Hymenobacter busanensis]QHJ08764.1 30S ribosomal protein THX [Hymenobacter busanensis]
MGKGDMKSRKGKLSAGTFGKRRPHKPPVKSTGTNTKPAAKADAPK